MNKMFRKLNVSFVKSISARYSTKFDLDSSIRESFDSQQYKPRKHPGTRLKIATIPPDIQKSIKVILQDTNAKSMLIESVKLNNFITSRLLPPEDDDIENKTELIHSKISKKFYSQLDKDATDEDKEKCQRQIEASVFNALKKNVYRWGNISYDTATCLQYLMCRAAPEYAVLMKILDEIRCMLPDYKPRSFFDFGSGIGTGTWAVNSHWKDDIYEYFCVDTSVHMHDLARLILCEGRDNKQMPLKAYFQRQFLPASTDLKYSIVLSAFSLFELPDMKSRLETIQKLWNKTEDFLIVVEYGSNAGFRIVNEAREFVLNLKKGKDNGYAFAPCPNDNVCPRYLEHKTPCNFLMKYETLPYSSKVEVRAELFSYVILRKGNRPKDDPCWPRVVRAPLVRSRHAICRLCTAQGELKETIFSKAKYDTYTYRCAKSSNWGDLLPVK